MSILGIGGGSALPLPAPRTAPERAAAVPRGPAQSPAAPEALTAAPPEGVDPSLWNVLTNEERAYFARVRSLGPLTYGPEPAAARPAVRGGRIDVTV